MHMVDVDGALVGWRSSLRVTMRELGTCKSPVLRLKSIEAVVSSVTKHLGRRIFQVFFQLI